MGLGGISSRIGPVTAQKRSARAGDTTPDLPGARHAPCAQHPMTNKTETTLPPIISLGICLPRPKGEGVTTPGGAAEAGFGSEGREARISSKGYRSQCHKRAKMLLE